MRRHDFARWLAGNMAEWCVTILMLLFGMTTIVQAFVVPSGSMESTLRVGDHPFVDKLVYAPVRRSDIIVFRYPLDLSMNYVKRVAGAPGDRIRMVNKRLWLNGRPVEDPYVQHISAQVDSCRD
jgi:signal peptidase I